MSELGTERRELSLDWDDARIVPMTVEGFMLILSGVAPYPVEVELRPQPIGIAPEDYRGVKVVGVVADATIEVETPWRIEMDTKEFGGARKGFVLLGATMTEYFPPKEED